MFKLALLNLVLLLLTQAADASNFPRVDTDLTSYDAYVAQLNADFDKTRANPDDKAWVTAKIQHMVDVDQYCRKYGDIVYDHQYSDDEAKEFSIQIGNRMDDVDAQDRADLKPLIAKYGWFSISLFGAHADENAWLIVQHADRDPDFQKLILSVLEPLVTKKETKPANYAYLFDRVAASYADPSKRQLQRYGTQGSCVAFQTWKPLPVEDPANLDTRRASVGLGSEADYIRVFVSICKKTDPPVL